MKKKNFLSGVIVLTLAMLIIQSSSMTFSVYVSSKCGAEAMGTFHLIMSVFSFSLTVAFSGIPLATSRLVSETKAGKSGRTVLKKAVCLSAAFGIFAGLALYILSPFICQVLLKNSNTLIPLRLLSASLPFMAISASVRGYFTGFGKVSCIVISKMAEEFSSILITLFLLLIFGTEGNVCLLLSSGIALSSLVAFSADISMCFVSVSSHTLPAEIVPYRSFLKISVPVATGSCIRSALNAVENVLIPICLAKSAAGNGLAQYGIIKGMALPVLSFPYVFLQSFISLLIPEISGRNSRKNKKGVTRAVRLSLSCTLVFSLLSAAFLFFFGKWLGLTLYNSQQAGRYIVALSLLAIPMYIDSVTDGLLKGLNQQVYSLKINIVDSLSRIPMLLILLPVFGGYGYIFILYISELMNLFLSYKRLGRLTR